MKTKKNKKHKVIYYGETILEAAENCLADQGFFDGEKSYKIISGKFLRGKIKCGFTPNRCEEWEFDIILKR